MVHANANRLVSLAFFATLVGCSPPAAVAPATTDAQDGSAAVGDAVAPDADAIQTEATVSDAVDPADASTAAANDAGKADDVVAPTDASPSCATAADCMVGPCQDAACSAGHCVVSAKADGTPCAAPTLCAAGGTCAAGTCAPAGIKPCKDDNICTQDDCDPATGECSHTPAVGNTCNDGNPCTKGDFCSVQGQCEPGSNVCATCTSAKDCAQYDDDNLCNGSLFCDLSLPTPVCAIKPGSVVFCDPSADSACAKSQCNPGTGLCTPKPMAEGQPCDDGNPCTPFEACSAGKCKAQVNACQCQKSSDCAAFDDGNPCNGTLYCDTTSQPYKCAVNPGSVVACPKSSDPCLNNICSPSDGGCVPVPVSDGAACSDFDSATVGDYCQAGTCVGGTNLSQCTHDSDCQKLEDGNLCNGTLFCNMATGNCQDNPKTAISCPSVDDTSCFKNLCQPKTGKCAMVAVNEGKACDDGNACTAGEVCKTGQCLASAVTCLCQQDADCASQEDGNLCNGKLYCDKQKGLCIVNPTTVVVCPSGQDSACQKNLCDPKSGACAPTAVHEGQACDDGNLCTAGEVCQAGQCLASADTCSCKKDSDCLAFEDGDLCNGSLYCNKQTGECLVNPASIVVCATALDGPCNQTSCNAKTGACEILPAHNGAQCDADGNACTQNDFCDQGVCKAGAMACNCTTDKDCEGKQGQDLCVLTMICDTKSHECTPGMVVNCPGSLLDGPCQTTACDPSTGQCATKNRADGTVCEKNTLCTGAQVCLSGGCVTGKAVNCDDINPCTADSCEDKQGGCLHAPLDATPCDDGSKCTTQDVCVLGGCMGATLPCNDDNKCTADSCDPKVACVHLPVAATACDDGNLCTLGDQCVQGKCAPGAAPLGCDDANPCTEDLCDPVQGCITKALSSGACDDGSACTDQDTCSAGSCAGVAVVCEDGDPCTDTACTKLAGCSYGAIIGAPCDDFNACTTGDKCNGKGLCTPSAAKVCDDGNPCTNDLCNQVLGCIFDVKAGVACDDGSKCTEDDVCSQGFCKGVAITCDDGNPCTTDGCKVDVGCVAMAKDGLPCNDNNACTKGDACGNGGVCAGSPVSCDDGNPCTDNTCDSASGCKLAILDKIPCSDGSACTVQDECASGICLGSPQTWSKKLATSPSLDDGLYSITTGPGGDVVAVGAETQTYLYKLTQRESVVYRYTATGQVVWSKVYVNDNFDDYLFGVETLADGTWLAVGAQDGVASALDPNPDRNIAWKHLSDDGFTWNGYYAVPGWQRLVAVARAADDTASAVGWDDDHGLIVRFFPNGQDILWIKNYAPPSGAGQLRAVAALPGKPIGWVAAGINGIQGWVTRYDANGTALWHRLLSVDGYEVKLRGVVVANSAVYVVGDVVFETTENYSILAALDLSGNLLWQRVSPVSETALAIRRVPGTSMLAWAGGLNLGSGTWDVAVRLVTAAGDTASQHTFDMGQQDFADAMVIDASGAIAVAGHTVIWADPMTQDSLIARADAFGNWTCGASGNCAGQPWASCDDSNPCTADTCSAGSGCQHNSMPEGMPCGSAKTCTNGACK